MGQLPDKVLQSKFKKSYLAITLTALAIFTISLSIVLYITFFNYTYIQFDTATLIIFPATFIYIILKALSDYYKRLSIDNNRLTIANLLGWNTRSYHLENLQSFAEMEMKDKYFSWKEIHLIYPEETIRLSSMTYENYNQLVLLLKGDKKENTYEYLRKRKKSMWLSSAAYCIVFAIICLTILYYVPDTNPKKLSLEDLQEIEGVLSEEPEINGHKQYSNQDASFVLKDFPETTFSLNRTNFYNSAYQDLEKKIHTGDTVYFAIEKDEYLTKLIKTKPLSFEQKHFESSIIEVYGIKDNKWIYLSTDQSEKWVNTVNMKDQLILGLFFTGFCIPLLIILQYSECIQSRNVKKM